MSTMKFIVYIPTDRHVYREDEDAAAGGTQTVRPLTSVYGNYKNEKIFR